MRLVTVARPDGSTVAARRDGDELHAFVDELGLNYPDVGALLRGLVDDAATEPLTGEHRIVRPVLFPSAIVCVGGQLRRAHPRDGPRDADEPDALPQARAGAHRPRRHGRHPARVVEGRLRGRAGRGDRSRRTADPARAGARPRRRRDADERRDDARLPVPLAPVVRRQVVARLDADRAGDRHARRARRPRRARADDRP